MDEWQAELNAAREECEACPACQSPFSGISHSTGCVCYDVKCARCGKEGPSCAMVIEEGDEWECPECWKRCQASERSSRVKKDG